MKNEEKQVKCCFDCQYKSVNMICCKGHNQKTKIEECFDFKAINYKGYENNSIF